jgi:WbqC-like protein family
VGKKIAIVQSNYIPWRGYFDLMNLVDEFILFDDMQYTRRDWRNRNLIKCESGLKWLSVPVKVKGRYDQKIKDTEVSNVEWYRHHWKSLVHCYSKAKHFPDYREMFEDLYLNTNETRLSPINYRFIEAICRVLSINTRITWSMDYQLSGDKTERLVNLCKQAGATNYWSGPSAKAYLNEGLFEREGIAVSYMDYSKYPTYNQLHPPFESGVSIVDLIFNEGRRARDFMMSF